MVKPSALAELLADIPTSQDIAEVAEQNGWNLVGAWCRTKLDNPPTQPNRVVQYFTEHPDITLQDLAGISLAVQDKKYAWFFEDLVRALHTHMGFQWVRPLGNLYACGRINLFSSVAMQTLAPKAIPLDEDYQLAREDQLREILTQYKDPWPYKPEDNDCDKKARRLWAFFSSLPLPRPKIGYCVISGQFAGKGMGHALNFAILPNLRDAVFIDNDGTIYQAGTSFGEWKNVVVQFALY